MSEKEPEAEYSLVYPFVACQSNGGPYEDTAFAAGFQCGEIAATLAAVTRALPAQMRPGQVILTWTVRADLEAQLDLVAMHHGFRLGTKSTYQVTPDWIDLTFVNADRPPTN